MRYTLFVTDSNSSKQLRSSEDLETLKDEADDCQKYALEDDENTDILYIIKQGYRQVYKARKVR
jgi:hypothetical protein